VQQTRVKKLREHASLRERIGLRGSYARITLDPVVSLCWRA